MPQKNIKKHGVKGFTLMELVIGMCLLGFLMALTVPLMVTRYVAWVDQSSAGLVADQMHDIAAASEKYLIENSKQPTSLGVLAPTCLSVLPVPPAHVGTYTWDSTSHVWGATSVGVTASIPVANATLCKQINILYAGAGVNAEPESSAKSSLNLQCWGDGSGAYTVTMRLFK